MDKSDIVHELIEMWSKDPELQVGVPYRRMARQAADLLRCEKCRHCQKIFKPKHEEKCCSKDCEDAVHIMDHILDGLET